MEAAFRKVPLAKTRAAQFKPTVVLTDDHLFGFAYKTIAEECNAAVAMHCTADRTLRQTRPEKHPGRTAPSMRIPA